LAAEAKLHAVIFCQPLAHRFSGEPLIHGELALPDSLKAGHTIPLSDIEAKFVSPHLRPSDVPLAFHRENPGAGFPTPYASATSLRPSQEMASRLEAYGRMLQYSFTDGTILSGHQILYHPHSKLVARHLLPLTINIKSDLQDQSGYMLETGSIQTTYRAAWQIQAEQTIISVLLSAIRVMKQSRLGDDDGRGPDAVCFTLSEDATIERSCLNLESVELMGGDWGPWRLTTALPEPVSGVYYGRARLELDPEILGDLQGLGRTFLLKRDEHKLCFHTFAEQLGRLKLQMPKPATTGQATGHTIDEPKALETGLAFVLFQTSKLKTAHGKFTDFRKALSIFY
jgi:hypothetical protein